jgi:hypothetical protein
LESMPFLHTNSLFTITFEDDLAFTEVRFILDQLLAINAFDGNVQQQEEAYNLACEDAFFSVWVIEKEVIIRRE